MLVALVTKLILESLCNAAPCWLLLEVLGEVPQQLGVGIACACVVCTCPVCCIVHCVCVCRGAA
jgi:hypothetical protein